MECYLILDFKCFICRVPLTKMLKLGYSRFRSEKENEIRDTG